MIATVAVDGYCPMGCGHTLVVTLDGKLECCSPTCPESGAVHELLQDREPEHVVWFAERMFTIRHPLRERLRDQLLRCELHGHIAGLPGPPVPPGRYRAVEDGASWTWERLDDPSPHATEHEAEQGEPRA